MEMRKLKLENEEKERMKRLELEEKERWKEMEMHKLKLKFQRGKGIRQHELAGEKLMSFVNDYETKTTEVTRAVAELNEKINKVGKELAKRRVNKHLDNIVT
ncbi:hypothetical protein scyTo_0004596 [Scyliorhinus torazame]|uniref:Uncharacterized protein n=1 Tax=Scyliorhinus torazame TaxID=75743 RepID=A0A401NU52_SCYTO|nr:hypothetical protein [Scyliorhinus torazame]